MTELRFRNIDVSPDAPVEDWGFEGLLAAVDRGWFRDWQRVAAAVRREPWGPVARTLEREVFEVAESPGVVNSLRGVIDLARADEQAAEQQAVADELGCRLRESGISRAEFADRLGTSQSRLSTYLSGKVTPSASLMVRARRVAERAGERISAASSLGLSGEERPCRRGTRARRSRRSRRRSGSVGRRAR